MAAGVDFKKMEDGILTTKVMLAVPSTIAKDEVVHVI